MAPPSTPVRNLDGLAVWRVKVGRGELTCTLCGETIASTENVCWRCGKVLARVSAVPTLNYLKEGEYELV